MKEMTPLKTLREINGETPGMLEQAQFADAAYGRIEQDPAPPSKSGGLPAGMHDAVFSNGGGYSGLVSPGGPGDTTEFPANVAGLNATHSRVDPRPDFSNVTPNQPDGFGDRGSGIDNIIRNGR